MTIDSACALALTFEPVSVVLERGRLRSFAQVIGETGPVYRDLDAARRAGHPDLPAPPTFLFSLELESADPFWFLTHLGVDLSTVLHGEQSFTYHRLAYAGDTLTVRPRIADVYTKKGGALEFLVKESAVVRGDEPVAQLRTLMVIRARQERG